MIRAILAAPLALLVFIAAPAEATDSSRSPPAPPPHLPLGEVIPTLHSSPLSNVRLGDLSVEFERTTLPELQKSAGVGETFHAGDAGDSTYWICYSVSSANQPYRIWFASGEMGGHEQAILSFYAEFSTYSVSPRSCPELPEHLRPVSLANNPLWLGADANQLKQRFGSASPRMVKGTWRFYAYEEKTRIKDEDFDRLATFGAQVRNNKVISLYEDQVTSD